MAGHRTVDELMDILEEECLEFDAVVSIVGGNNKYDYQVITVPKKNVHIKKDGAYIDMLGLDQPFFFPNSEVPCGFKNAIFYLTKDRDSFFVSACFLDEETQKLSKDEQIRTVDRHCIAEFLEEKAHERKVWLQQVNLPENGRKSFCGRCQSCRCIRKTG